MSAFLLVQARRGARGEAGTGHPEISVTSRLVQVVHTAVRVVCLCVLRLSVCVFVCVCVCVCE